MRSRNYFFIAILNFSLILIFLPIAYAFRNIRPYEEMPINIILSILGPVLINILVEFGVVFMYLRNPLLIKKDLIISVILVNIVLFPPTQTIAYFLMIFSTKDYVFFVIIFGILMILIEWVFYRLEFKKLQAKNIIPETLSLKKTILISTVANVVSFCVIYLAPVLILINDYIRYPELYSSSIALIIQVVLFS
ncbi:MAG: hypothetical protein ACFFCV_20490 [Promethearchaeota archaeon]